MQLSEIREQIRMGLPPEVSDVTDAMLNTLVNQALKECSVAAKWPFLHTSTTITTQANRKNYSLPEDFLYGLKLVDNDRDDELEYVAPAQFFEWHGSQTRDSATSTASQFTIYDGEIYLYPTPSANDTDRYTFYYYRQITALTQDSDEPEFLDTFHWLPVEWAKWKLYERESMSQESDRAFGQYAQLLERMRQWYTTPVKQEPWIAGDGVRRRLGDPNLPMLNYVQ